MGLALVAAVRGYKCVFTSHQKVDEALGAKSSVCPRPWSGRLPSARSFLNVAGGREDALVSANRRDERQAHAGITRSAFNDRAPGFQKAFFLGFVDHADARCDLSRSRRDW